MSVFIYQITNLLNDKTYIGQTNNPDRRWEEHQWYAKNKQPKQVLHEAMIKHGIENFEHRVLVELSSREEANEAEIRLIAEYSSLAPNGYNIERGGNYAPCSEEALLKISQALKGRPSRNKGVPCSEEQKQKTSQTMTGRTYPKERVEKAAAAMKGRIPWNKGKSRLSPEQKKAISTDDRPYRAIGIAYDIDESWVFEIKKAFGTLKPRPSDAQMLAVILDFKTGQFSIPDLVSKHNLTYNTIRSCLMGKTWCHLNDQKPSLLEYRAIVKQVQASKTRQRSNNRSEQ